MAGLTPVSLMRSVRWFASSYVIAVAGYLALNALVSRFVGTTEFGLFMVIITATTILGQVGLVGVHRSGLREAAQLLDGDTERLGDLRAGVQAVTSIALPSVSVLTGIATWFLLQDRAATSRLWLAILAGTLVYLTGQQRLCANFLRGLGHVRLAGFLEGRSGGALVALSQTGAVLLVMLLLPDSGLVGALAGTVTGFALPVLYAKWILKRRWVHTQRPRGRWRNLLRVVRRDWRYAVVQVGGLANSSMDLWLAAALLSPVSTSLYGAAQRLSQLLFFPRTSLQVVFSPAIARMSLDTDREPLQALLRTGSSLVTAVVAVMALPMLLIPSTLLVIVFGADFADAAPVLMLLVSGYLVNAMSGLAAVTLSMCHEEGWVAAVQWAALGLRIALGASAALLFGLVGLAASSMTITILMSALMWWQARRRVGVSTHATLRPRLRLLSEVRG